MYRILKLPPPPLPANRKLRGKITRGCPDDTWLIGSGSWQKAVTDQIGMEEIVCEMHERRSVLSKQPAII